MIGMDLLKHKTIGQNKSGVGPGLVVHPGRLIPKRLGWTNISLNCCEKLTDGATTIRQLLNH